MIDVPNRLISAISMLNKTQRSWAIEKAGREHYYIGRIGSRGVVKADLIDDLIGKMLEIAEYPDSEPHVVGFDT